MKKKFLSVLLIVAVLIGMAGVSGTQTESGEQKADKEQKQQEHWHILTESGQQQKMSVFRSRISSGKSVSVRMMAAKVR